MLRELRAIDPQLDAFIVRSGDVWLLQRQEDRGRIVGGREAIIADRAEQIEDYIGLNVQARLSAQGFALLAILPFHEGTSCGAAVAAVSRVLRRTERDVEDDGLETRRAMSPEVLALKRLRTIRERIATDALFNWKWAYRGKRHFTRRGA